MGSFRIKIEDRDLDINKIFNEIIESLKKGERPLLKFEENEIEEINSEFKNIVHQKKWSELFPILCILDNCQTLSDAFTEAINGVLANCDDQEILVLTLGVSRKHIIEFNHKKGNRVPFDFIKSLKEKLSHQDPEVLEWTLRLIESLGSQSIILKEDVLKNKPGIGAIFNQHKKASKQIIELLEKRWI